MFLDSRRKLEYLWRTCACTGTTCKLHVERPWSMNQTLYSCKVTVLETAPQCNQYLIIYETFYSRTFKETMKKLKKNLISHITKVWTKICSRETEELALRYSWFCSNCVKKNFSLAVLVVFSSEEALYFVEMDRWVHFIDCLLMGYFLVLESTIFWFNNDPAVRKINQTMANIQVIFSVSGWSRWLQPKAALPDFLVSLNYGFGMQSEVYTTDLKVGRVS